jgi:hypothetical protein
MVKFDAVYWQILDDVLQFYYLDDCDYQVKVGSRHKHFRIAVIDLDGLMTGNSRPFRDSDDRPLYS